MKTDPIAPTKIDPASLARENRILIAEAYLREVTNNGTIGRLAAFLGSIAHADIITPELASEAASLERVADRIAERFNDFAGTRTVIIPDEGPQPFQFRLWVDQAEDRNEQLERIQATFALLSISAHEKREQLQQIDCLYEFASRLCDSIGNSVEAEIESRFAAAERAKRKAA
jgi:hypothetical protein